MSARQLPYPSAAAPTRLRTDLVEYLRHPRPRVVKGPLPDFTWAKMVSLQLLSLLVTAPFMAVGFAIVSDREFVANEDIGPITLLLLAVVAAPLIEEFAFRFAVVEYRPLFLVVGGLVFGAFMALVILSSDLSSVAKGAVLCVAGAVAVAVVILGLSRSAWAAALWRRSFVGLFYGSAVVFGLFHLTNYSFGDLGPLEIAALPLLVAPQILGGALLGYTRVRLGILASMGQHAAYNFMLVSLALLGGA